MDKLLVPGIVAGIFLYKGYEAFRIPDELKHIPPISISSLLKLTIQGEGYDEIYEQLIKPVLKEYGCGLIWNQGRWELIIIDPKRAREILSLPEKFPKSPEENKEKDNRLMTKLLGKHNVVLSDGNEWRRHRKVANPAFKQTWDTQIFGKVMMDVVEFIENEERELYINVVSLFRRLTLDALGKGLFSYDFGAVKSSKEDINMLVYDKVMYDLAKPLYFMFPILESIIPSRIQSYQDAQQFRNFLQKMVSERRKEIDLKVAREDLLTRIIQASQNEQNNILSDEEVINNLAVFFLAGHETTASTLTTTFYYLCKHPEFQEKAHAEVLKVLGNPKTITVPTNDQIKDMEYINCIIKESMRMVTTVSQIRRISHQSVSLSDGFHIPANTPIVIQNWALHHDKDIYLNPYKFNPDRFLTPHNKENIHWMPFGSGSRMCIGMNFSLLEQRVVLAMLIQKFTFHLDPILLLKPIKLSNAGIIRALEVNIQFRNRSFIVQ